MNTILDEILMEEYPSSELHEGNCGCNECKEDMEIDLETLLEDMEDETTVSSTPTPGAYYQIKRGDNLLKVVGKAYKVGEGEEIVKLAQMVNSDPLNKKFWRKPDNAFERSNFKDGIISFSPRFNCGEEQSVAKRGEKKCYAKIFISNTPVPSIPSKPSIPSNPTNPVPNIPKRNILDFRAKNTKLIEGVSVPNDMPTVNFPIIVNTPRSKRNEIKVIKEAWVLAHFYMWRAYQFFEFLNNNPSNRKLLWVSGYISANLYNNYSPRTWFGPYDEKRFDLIRDGINKVWKKYFFSKSNVKITPRSCPGFYAEAIHAGKGIIMLCDPWFIGSNSTFQSRRARTLIHELFHHIRLKNGLYVMDLHSYYNNKNKLVSGKLYEEPLCYLIAHHPGKNNRNYNITTRNNDSYAIFMHKLGEEIRNKKLLTFP